MSRSLQVLLFGHHHVGVAVFHQLREAGHQVTACFTHSTNESWIPSLADACGAAQVPCRVDCPEAADGNAFRDARPDLIVSAGYRRRVSLPFLALPTRGAINAHLGPLPQYRGAWPIPWGILSHESAWAVTIHAMTHNYNEGGILRKQPIALRENDNAFDLFLRSSQVAARVLVETVNEIAEGGGELTPQDLRSVQFFDAALPFGGHVDWNQPAIDLAAFVRAMDFGRGHVDGAYEHLAPPASATLAGAEIGIWRARAGGTVSGYAPGTITRCDDEVWVQASRGHLVIERLCDASGRDFTAAEYLSERGIMAGQAFDTHHVWRAAESKKLGFAA